LCDELARRHGEARRRERREGRPSLLAWCRQFLPEHFRRPPSVMHRWLAGRLEQIRDRRGARLNLLAPRGSAKSTLATLAYPLWAALEKQEPYVWILSDTKQQAHAHLENLKAELTENPRLAAEYPESAGRGPVWRSGAIVLCNGACIEAFGTGQRIRGRRRRAERPTLIVCDDLQNDGHILSARERERSRTWFFGTLLKAGTPATNVLHLATALHREALAMELTRTPGWTSRTFRAIARWPENLSLWEEWEAIYADVENPCAAADARRFYEARREAMDRGAAVLWPELEDLYALMCMRAEGGQTAFEREKQNSPVAPELCEWPEAYFDETIWFEAWPERLVVRTLALDPSKGRDARRGDFSAIVRLGVDRQGLLYVEADLARRPTPQIVAEGVEHVRQFRPDAFAVEANQYQELLGAAFEEEFARQGLLGARPRLLENHVNKQVRIRRLGPYLASRRLRFRSGSPSTRLLVEQLRTFPLGDHDDRPDALEMALRLAGELLAPPPDDGLGQRLWVE
jgi:predicted phage terminase large subunit-like protein